MIGKHLVHGDDDIDYDSYMTAMVHAIAVQQKYLDEKALNLRPVDSSHTETITQIHVALFYSFMAPRIKDKWSRSCDGTLFHHCIVLTHISIDLDIH